VRVLQRLEARNGNAETSEDAEFIGRRTAFIAERVAVPTGTNKNKRKQLAGKNLNYDAADKSTREGLDGSRRKEWKKWMDFDAGVIIEKDTLRELMDEGHSLLPTQWIDTDQNEHLKRPGKPHTPEFKSRLVACGQLENCKGVRADSPTCDVEGLNMICSWAACNKLRVDTADIRNAYFNADPMDRLMLLKPPRGGIPDQDNDIAIAANKPIYGTKDAGRRFYKTFRRIALEQGLKGSRFMKSLYYLTVDGKVMVMMAAHVDDLLWAAMPGYEDYIPKFLANFEIKKQVQGSFRFCGRHYEQDADFNITINATDNTEKVLPINFTRGDRGPEDKATAGEIAQMRSVIGSLAWVARQVRPELCYQTSKLQSVVATALVKHLEQCNKVLQEAKATASRGLFFKAGAFNWDDAILVTTTDASWANEKKIIDGHIYPRRSQFGRINAIGSPDLWDGDNGVIHIIGWKSGLIRRMCRSTFRAESQGMTYGTETGVYIRAVFTEVHGKFEFRNWESACAKCMKHVWFTDCQSLHDYLVNPVAAGCEDKRLEIDLEGLREYLWEDENGIPKDDMNEDIHDKPRWVDTSAMICDPLTKAGNEKFADRLAATMSTGRLTLEASPESQIRKMKQQKARKNKSGQYLSG